MKLFYEDRKVNPIEVYEAVSKCYGVSNPTKIQGYAGTFLFSLGKVYVSDMLQEHLEQDNKLDGILRDAINRFIKEDYGNVTKDEDMYNIECRYWGNGTGMKGIYQTPYGDITIIAEDKFTLIQFLREENNRRI